VGIAQHIDRKDLLKVESLIYNQIRGFKTRHSHSMGVGGSTTAAHTASSRDANDFDGYRLAAGSSGRHSQFSNDSNQPPLTAFVNRFMQYARGNSPSQNIDGKRLQDILHTTSNTDEQQKVKIAFAEGYVAAAGEPKPKERPSLFKAIRVILFYGLLIMIILNILSAFGGDGVRGGFANAFSTASKYEINPEEIKVNFGDVRGAEEAKDELMDIVQYLKEPEKYTKLGARLPKGVLLVGAPGTGKTLLARAVAGEAGVPFFHTSGSEFDEMFVGTGARRVRQLFTAAKSRAPCVIFIDEIDSVGAKRSSSQLHPYANQTINQLLAEMDGFEKNEGIIVLAATNRRDYLDSALLRPGRFDSEIHIAPPDLRGRKEIFELYLSKVTHDHTVDTEYLAKGTTGFTGADIENMVNQAALYAAQIGAQSVTMKHLEHARDKILMGPAKKSKIPDAETNNITAYHEAGHTIVRYFTNDADPLHKVTIVPRGQALGFTAHIPIKEAYNRTRSQLLAEMDVMMAGRAAEEQIFGIERITTGAASDFNQATKLATNMVKQFGMSEKVGTRSFREEEQDAGIGFVRVNDISPTMQEMIDLEIKRIMQESYDRAKALLKQHSHELKLLAEALLHFETLSADEVKAVLEGRKINP
jgi:ATP-dependent metalloprotease